MQYRPIKHSKGSECGTRPRLNLTVSVKTLAILNIDMSHNYY